LLNRRNILVAGAAAAGAATTLGSSTGSSRAAASPAKASAPPIQSLTLSVNGLTFDAISCGPQTGTLLLCLHGFPQFKETFTPVLQAFGSLGFRAVAVDQRGYSPGAQVLNISDYTTANLVSDVLGFATALGASSFHLLGHDYGSFIGWHVAAQNPKSVLTFTSLSTPQTDAYAAALATDQDQQARSAYIPLFQQSAPTPENQLLANNASELRLAYQGVNPGSSIPPSGLLNVVPQSEINSNVMKFSQGNTLTCALNWYRAGDVNPVGNITVPSMLIWGANDQALGRTSAINTANFCTGPYQFVQLTGRSHWLLEEVPDDIITLVQENVTRTLT
jgi:pimeloyl-ACP methyl ester carboxylesterase